MSLKDKAFCLNFFSRKYLTVSYWISNDSIHLNQSICPSETEGLVKFHLQPICNVCLIKFSIRLVQSKMQTHFVNYSLMLSLKDRNLPDQISFLSGWNRYQMYNFSKLLHSLFTTSFLVKSLLIIYFCTLALLIKGNGFCTVLLYNLHGAQYLWPQFSVTLEILVQVQSLLQSF